MNFRNTIKVLVPLFLLAAVFAAEQTAKTTTVKGYVLDSACAFTKGLKKPISAVPYAGKTVTVSGKVFQRSGSTAIVISKIEEAKE